VRVSADQLDRAGGTVVPAHVDAELAAPQASAVQVDLDGQASQVGVDEDGHVIVEGLAKIALESAALGAGVDRHLEAFASTVWFEQIDHGGTAPSADDVSSTEVCVDPHV